MPSTEAGAPRIGRTLFAPIDPPVEMTLWFCPACGRLIEGSYSLEPARKRCTRTWHLANPVGVKYTRVEESGINASG